ncbi:MAG: tetratricopeptide repeat protein [Deltaproteobacteria bacterium]|nr:tetratricopeptide repeat protein [Deltaproteobacteria bacterium]
MATTYYEEHDYKRALTIGQQAHDIAPLCPLVLWDLAGTFDMLGRQHDAIGVYRRLIRRGVEAIAFGDCGEGLAWARGLVADCWYRLARCQSKIGRRADAARCYERHVAMRGPGCRSIYRLKDVRKELRHYDV